MSGPRLIVLVGQEGAGKSTTVRALAEAMPSSARIDAEDVVAVNPWKMDGAFLQLMWKNVADLTRNFWEAGYRNVVAGSFASNIDDYRLFRGILNMVVETYVVQLCATKATRDVRRIHRGKPTSEEWRDMVDRVDPEDTSFALTIGEFQFLRIENDGFDVMENVGLIRRWSPELFAND